MSNVVASFDVTTLEGKKRLFNAKNGASQSMKNLPDGHVIDVVGALIYPDTTDTYGKDQEVKVTVLFDTNGDSYAGVSETVANATENLIDFLSDLDEGESVRIKIVHATSSKGNQFLNLQMV